MTTLLNPTNVNENHSHLNETMPNHYCFTFSAVELTVRNCGNGGNDLDVISCYVHLGLQKAKQYEHLKEVRTGHMRIVNTLIDTMCDSALPIHWRKHCYRYIKSLLPLLFEMLSLPKYRQKTKEIETLHNFFIKDSIQNKHTANIQKTSMKK